jgi:hypothetical protein
MQVFDTAAEAVALANDGEYGVAASILTRDIEGPLRIARDLDRLEAPSFPASHRQYDPESRVAAHHARIRLARLFERIGFNHRAYPG